MEVSGSSALFLVGTRRVRVGLGRRAYCRSGAWQFALCGGKRTYFKGQHVRQGGLECIGLPPKPKTPEPRNPTPLKAKPKPLNHKTHNLPLFISSPHPYSVSGSKRQPKRPSFNSGCAAVELCLAWILTLNPLPSCRALIIFMRVLGAHYTIIITRNPQNSTGDYYLRPLQYPKPLALRNQRGRHANEAQQTRP